MNREEEKIAKALKRALPSPRQMESMGERILQRLRSESDSRQNVPSAEPLRVPRKSPWGTFMVAAAAVIVLFIGVIAVFRNGRGTSEDIAGVVERDIERKLYPGGTVLPLADGSRVEVESNSEFSVDRTSDGVRIALAAGRILINAAKQTRTQHLYVQTKDLTATVAGTMFRVEADETGSRVAVIEGEVRVQHGAISKTLIAGQEHLALLEPPAPRTVEPVPVTKPDPPQTKPQTPQQAPITPVPPRNGFDVAVIKHNSSGAGPIRMTTRAGKYIATNVPLRQLILMAYRIDDFQLSGEPGWVNSEHYDIEATTDPGRSMAEIGGPMLQGLLETRFGLRLHGETREAPVYFVTWAKDDANLTTTGDCIKPDPNVPMTPEQRALAYCGLMSVSPGSLQATSVRMDFLTQVLSRLLKRKVFDKTGFSAEFDVNLKFAPDLTTAGDRPSIFTALEEQLGLRLEAGRAPIDVLVVDHIERPSEN